MWSTDFATQVHDHGRRILAQTVRMSCNDISMKIRISADSSDELLRTLAEFRFELRRFLHFSERAALNQGFSQSSINFFCRWQVPR